MSQYTKAYLESLNKGPLVEVALNLVTQLDAASGEPLTSAAIEKKLLELNSKSITVKAEAEKAHQAHVEKLAQINADKDKAVRELELKYESTLGNSAVELNTVYDEIKVKAGEAVGNLSYGLKEAEIEAKGKLEVIQKKQVEATEKFEATVEGYKEQVASAQAEKAAAIKKIEVDHARNVEQLTYDNSIAIRDENEKVASAIAKALGKELVLSSEYAAIKGAVKASDDEIAAAIAAAVTAEANKIYAKEKAAYSKLESESNSRIALLENDKAHLAKTNQSQEARINDLEDRLKDVPAQIAAAVGAAKANVSVAQTSGK